MAGEARRLIRLQRLEKVRAIAKQVAATEAARAESTLAQLEGLAARTGRLVADYAGRLDLADAGALQQLTHFRSGLQSVALSTTADAARARGHADEKHAELAAAERRRQAVEDRAKSEAATLSLKTSDAPLGARRGFGTELDK
jgi:hypothetical protein